MNNIGELISENRKEAIELLKSGKLIGSLSSSLNFASYSICDTISPKGVKLPLEMCPWVIIDKINDNPDMTESEEVEVEKIRLTEDGNYEIYTTTNEHNCWVDENSIINPTQASLYEAIGKIYDYINNN